MSWQKDSKDYVPFVEEGAKLRDSSSKQQAGVAESPLAEDLPQARQDGDLKAFQWQARRWACGAVGLLAA